MYPTLYEMLTRARVLYDEPRSPFICDCITLVEDEIHHNLDYPITRPLLDFVKQDIKYAYSVDKLLFPRCSGHYELDQPQRKECREYREGLWQRLFDEFADR